GSDQASRVYRNGSAVPSYFEPVLAGLQPLCAGDRAFKCNGRSMFSPLRPCQSVSAGNDLPGAALAGKTSPLNPGPFSPLRLRRGARGEVPRSSLSQGLLAAETRSVRSHAHQELV